MATHDHFVREGDDLVADVPIGFAQAALGAHITFVTLDGDEEELAIAPGTQSGRELRIRGKGVPSVNGRGRGDLRVVLRVETPTKLEDGEVELLRQFAEARGEDDRPAVEGPVPEAQVRLHVSLQDAGQAHAFVTDLSAPALGADDRHHFDRVLRLRPGDGHHGGRRQGLLAGLPLWRTSWSRSGR